jgi:hypothetical protein
MCRDRARAQHEHQHLGALDRRASGVADGWRAPLRNDGGLVDRSRNPPCLWLDRVQQVGIGTTASRPRARRAARASLEAPAVGNAARLTATPAKRRPAGGVVMVR